MILPNQQVTHTELAAEEQAFIMLERESPNVAYGIEKDLKKGLTPEILESIWLRVSGQEKMARRVGMAARFVERGGRVRDAG